METLKRIVSGVWKVFLGGFLAQGLVTAPIVVGWTYRGMQGVAYRRWLKLAGKAQDPALLHEAPPVWPRWSLREPSAPVDTPNTGFAARLRNIIALLFASLGRNLRVGVPAIFNTFVVTAFPALLWYFGWLGGWNISFYKEYEGAAFGITVTAIGILLFIAAMLYVPMAQARQAVTGEWKRFYDFKLVRRITRSQPLPMLLLAAAYSLVSIPVVLLVAVLPMGFGDKPAWAEKSDAQFLQDLNGYFLFVSIVGFVAYWMLHRLAARMYARGVYRLVTRGELDPAALAPCERKIFDRLGIAPPSEERARGIAAQAVEWLARPAWRTALATATLLIWFTFVAQIFVSEFFNYHPRSGFLNQPLVQLPVFRHVPDALTESVRAERRNQTPESDRKHATFY
jgi:hypothetical protein